MENQHKLIKGYRDLTQEDVNLMNEIKQHAEVTDALLCKVRARIEAQFQTTYPSYAEPKTEADEALGTECIDTVEQTMAKNCESERLKQAECFRWHAIAKTNLQQGFMALVRAVAQPTTF